MVWYGLWFVNQLPPQDYAPEMSPAELLLASRRILRHDPGCSILLSRINGDPPQASKILAAALRIVREQAGY